MATTEEFLDRLSGLGIQLSVKAGQPEALSFSAPAGVMDGSVRAEILARKAELIAHLRAVERPAAAAPAPLPRANRTGGLLPLSMAQEQLWFLDRLEGPSATYNMFQAVRVLGALDPGVWETALNDVVCRHEALRTTLVAAPDAALPGQRIHETLTVPLMVVDLCGVPVAGRSAAGLQQAEAWIRQPFDLAVGPLLRAGLVRLGPEEHLLVLVLHHAVADGWSLGILWREWGAACRARLAGQTPLWPELPIQFADYAVWEREQLRAGVWEPLLPRWQAELAGVPPVLELPTDRPRSARQSNRGAHCFRKVEPAVVAAVRRVGRQQGAGLYAVLLCAWQALLARYSGQRDLVVGSPVARRQQPELEPVIGFLVNTVPLRTRWPGNPTLGEALAAVQDTVLRVLALAAVPFERLVQELNPQRSLLHNPIFQVGLALEHWEADRFSLPGVTVEPLRLETGVSRFELMLWLTQTPDGLEASLEYSTDLFDDPTADRLLGYFEHLLRHFGDHLATPLSRLDLLPAAERRQLEQWHGPARDYPAGRCLHELVWAQVESTPGAVAVMCGDTRWSYRELWARAGRVAAALRARGVGPGALVGVFVERSADLVAAVLGVLQSGAAYVPMDPLFPRERLGWMIEDAALPVILTQSSLVAALPPHQAQLVCLDQPLPETLNSQLPTPNSKPEDPAYVIFTSGSTGRPKGVVVGHRNVVNFLCSMRREPGLTSDDVLLAVTTLSFDIAGLELFLPLITGARVVIASRAAAADGAALAAELERVGATVLQATPVTWRLLLAAGWKGSPRLKALVGGEAVPRELVNQLAPRCGEVWNLYGPTETTIWSTCGRLAADEGPVSIGRPIANTQVYIVNEALQLQPVGVPGELLIGGDGVARGYLNRPELTAEKFIANPFGEGRVYRTGDLAKWRPDGTLECLGRLDHQVKVRGFRIELGEIETALERHPAVQQAVVVLREEELVAYVVPAAAAPSGPMLRESLRERLPEYMVPARYVVLAELPLTPNGKVDRKALPAPGQATEPAAAGRRCEGPRTETERRLVAIWEEVMKRAPIGIHDHFFDLGGHSLLAVALFARIEAGFKIKLPLATLFQHQTIAQLALLLDQRGEPSAGWRSLVQIRKGNARPALFLVHGAGGNILIYRSLAQQLAEGVPVFGLQSLGLDGATTPLTSVEEMAAAYVEEVVRQQPAGPYFLAGYCMGGKIAYEMARLLAIQGRGVGWVALLDSYNFESAAPVGRFSYYRQLVGFHLRNLAALKPGEVGGYLGEKSRMLVEVGQARALAMLGQVRRFLRSGRNGLPVEQFIQQFNDRAGEVYSPRPYGGRVIVFKPHRNYSFFTDPHMGWRGVSRGELDLVELEVNPHAMLVEPFVCKLASALNPLLAPR
jgi:amino acid adenylation domain-containing protein